MSLDTNDLVGSIPKVLCEENVFITADSCAKGAPVICECCFCSINDLTAIIDSTSTTDITFNLDIVKVQGYSGYSGSVNNSLISFFDENI